jgi:hypothetical protein
MNEIPPPPSPDKDPAQPPTVELKSSSTAPSKGACAGMGVALFFLSCLGGIVLHPLPVLGLIGAFASLFFEDYRYIFVGYILTALILLGIGFLVLITVCGNMNFH